MLNKAWMLAAKGKPPKLVEPPKQLDPTTAPIIKLKFQVSQRKVRLLPRHMAPPDWLISHNARL